MSLQMDATDKKILKYLSQDSSVRVVEIAQRLGVTSAAVHQRISKIKKTGVVKEFTLRLNEKELGYSTCAFIGVYTDMKGQYNDVVEELEKIDEIVEVHYTTGQYSLFIKLFTRDNDHLMKVLSEQVQQISGILRTDTLISLEESISRNIRL